VAFRDQLNAFVARWNGKRIRSAGGLGGQCVDLVEQYAAELFTFRPLPGNAVDLFGKNTDEWTWTRNNPADPSQLPPHGAVMVWHGDSGIGTGGLGHTAVVLASDHSGFTSFDQNWPVGANAHEVRHTYEGITGWGVPHDRMGRSLLVDRVAPTGAQPPPATVPPPSKPPAAGSPPAAPAPAGLPPIAPPPGPPIDQTRSAWAQLAKLLTSTLPAAWRELLRLLGVTRSI
jgi:CHAP domain